MARNENFWMRWNWDERMTDAAVEGLSEAEFRVWMWLCWKAWMQEVPVGTLPDDDVVLARYGRQSEKGWRRMKGSVMRGFVLREDARWHLPWMEAASKEVEEIESKRRFAALVRYYGLEKAKAMMGGGRTEGSGQKSAQDDCKRDASALHTHSSGAAGAVLGLCVEHAMYSYSQVEREKGRGGQRSEDRSQGSEGEWGPTVEEVVSWGPFEGLTEEECRAFHAHYAGLNWMHGQTRIEKPRLWMRKWKVRGAEMKEIRRQRPEVRNNGNGETIFSKKTRMESLKRVAAEHRGNPQWSGYEDGDEAAKKEFREVKKGIGLLEREIAGVGKEVNG